MDGELMISSIAVAIALLTFLFLAYQTHQQRMAGQMTFNLEVMKRLDVVLLEIEDRPDAFSHIWDAQPPKAPPRDNHAGHVLTQSLTDVLELALQATEKLPGFAGNADDWHSYADYVFSSSAAVRQEVGDNPQWWPAVAKRLALYQAKGSLPVQPVNPPRAIT